MPLWMFFAGFGFYLALAMSIMVAALWLGARLVGVRPSVMRLLLIYLACFAAGIAARWPVIAGVQVSPEAAFGLTCVVPIVAYVAIKLGLRVGWLRALVALLVQIIVGVPSVLGVGVASRALLWEGFVISTPSMAPTIQPGDHVMVDRRTAPLRWDVVAFHPPHEPGSVYLSRLVGLPGESIEIIDGEIRINGAPVQKPPEIAEIRYDGTTRHFNVCRGGTGSPVKLGADEYFLLSDNSSQALDSRYWPIPATPHGQPGTLARTDFVGVARWIYVPLRRQRILDPTGH